MKMAVAIGQDSAIAKNRENRLFNLFYLFFFAITLQQFNPPKTSQ
jgi:hypothetical protein